MTEKDLGITEVKGAKANINDLVVYGNGDTFALLCKASSQSQGWMKSTKVCNVGNDALVQITTQQRNPDGSYALAEALTFVPNVNIDCSVNPRVLKSTGVNAQHNCFQIETDVIMTGALTKEINELNEKAVKDAEVQEVE